MYCEIVRFVCLFAFCFVCVRVCFVTIAFMCVIRL